MLVDIAMATYNGEEFIESQIRSIMRQTFSDWRLIISDDGSNDNTIPIINKLMLEDERIRLVNQERQGGVVANFNKALMMTGASYIVTCDQDDIWPVDRLEKLYFFIKNKESNYNNGDVPMLVFSDLTLVDKKGSVITESFYKFNKINPLENMNGNNLIWRCTVYGCTMIFNKDLLDISLPIPETASMHDQWLALKAKKFGELIYFNYPSVLYRQHDNNEVGAATKGLYGKIINFRKNLQRINKNTKKIKSNLSSQDGLYYLSGTLKTENDFRSFAIKEILPWVIKGDKKIQILLIFYFFMVSK